MPNKIAQLFKWWTLASIHKICHFLHSTFWESIFFSFQERQLRIECFLNVSFEKKVSSFASFLQAVKKLKKSIFANFFLKIQIPFKIEDGNFAGIIVQIEQNIGSQVQDFIGLFLP